MKPILVTADLHLSANPRDHYRLDWQAELRRLVKRHSVGTTLILGDLTEEKDHHGAWLVNRMVEAFVALAKLCQIVIIRGNHDYVDTRDPFYAFLSNIPNISWIGNLCYADKTVPDLEALGKVLLLPHSTKPEQDWKAVSLKSYDWVFTHMTFQGAHVGHGQQMSGLSTGTFGKANVISGDIHVPQKLTARVQYVGAPYLVDFGDKYEPRVLLLEDGGLRSIPCKGPQKRLVELGSLGELKHHPTVNTKYVNEGDILKVRVIISAEQVPQWQEMKQTVREWGEKIGCQIYTVEPVLLDTIRGREEGKRTVQTKTDKQLLLEYAKVRGVDERTLKTGLRLLRRA